MSTIESRVKQVIIEQVGVFAGVSVDDLKPETKFADDLGADSMDEVELVMALEDEFEIEIPDNDAEKITTVQQAVEYVAGRVPA